MPELTKTDILRIAKEEDIKFIRLQFTDIFGQMKNVAITISQLDKALDNKVMFDGSSIEGFARIEESDMYLFPDTSTFTIFPWAPSEGKTARMICDVHNPEGASFQGDPRNVLKRAIDEASELGYVFNVGPELEFFLFNTDACGNPTMETQDNAGYFDLAPIDMGGSARRDICLTLEEMGFEIEASHHESARGQHEIDFKYDHALKTADNIMTFKMVVKRIAQKHKLHASFMPKPFFGTAGSGMHTNMSLFKDGENVFCDETDPNGLSKTAYQFMAGILAHIEEFVALTNPLVNSYKRLVPGYEAPCYIAWSTKNRSPLIRVPYSRGGSTRIELRCPDPSANPYLALAACLSAGIDGIKRELTPPKPVDLNIYGLSENERKRLKIRSLPLDLDYAIANLKNSKLMRKVLDEHIFTKYVSAKEHEWEDYRSQISAWELEKYFLY